MLNASLLGFLDDLSSPSTPSFRHTLHSQSCRTEEQGLCLIYPTILLQTTTSMKTKTLLFILLFVSFSLLSCGKKGSSQQEKDTNETTKSDTIKLSYPSVDGDIPYEVFLEDGRVSLYLPLALRQELSLGSSLYLPEDVANPEGKDLFEVTRLAGSCVNIFVGDIGQDTNPMLCMLLSDGRVQLLNIFQAVLYKDFNASAPIKELRDIKSFESKVVDNTYVTIFAKDASGKGFEILPFMVKHELRYPILNEVGNPPLIIVLTSDYKIQILMDRYEGSWEQVYRGTFEGPDWLDEGQKGNYTFNLFRLEREDGQGAKAFDIKETGNFSLTPKEGIGNLVELTSSKIAEMCDVDATQTYK